MGCNSSKEVTLGTEELEKSGENNIQEEDEEEKIGTNINEDDFDRNKQSAAKTASLRSAGYNSEENLSIARNSSSSHQSSQSQNQQLENTLPVAKTAEIFVVDEEEAALKIQAAFRGHRARKKITDTSMKQQSDNQGQPDESREALEAEFSADDVELCKAATKIQASFRGHMSRKGDPADDKGETEEDKGDCGGEPLEDELDIDLADPELSKAAVKIQASFRGHMARKDNNGADGDKDF